MRMRVTRLSLVVGALFLAVAPASAREPAGLNRALERLAAEGQFSGAVVVRGPEGVRFAQGHGLADPFTGRLFTPETPADSGSLAKPVTAALVLLLARQGAIHLDSPVTYYLPDYPHRPATVRHLLAHSAGLALEDSPQALAGKSNADLLAEATRTQPRPLFPPGSAFAYCNLCTVVLALIIERVTGQHYLQVARERAALPAEVTLRPRRLSDWTGRAIGYRRGEDGKIERFDSWEGEAFYGSANLSLSAAQLAQWGSEWSGDRLASIRPEATASAMIAGRSSGLSWGNWHCAGDRARCHYLGHHEGFHHMLYWDSRRRISLAMVSNNALSPALQQRLQRALVAFAEGRTSAARRELAMPLPDAPPIPGAYRLKTGERVTLAADGDKLSIRRRGIAYPAYRIGSAIRYVPGLDLYLAGERRGLRFLSLHEDYLAAPERRAR